MSFTHGAFGDRVCKHTNLRKHIHDRTLCSSWCKIFDHIKTNRSSANNNDFFTLTCFIRVFSCIQIIDHSKDCCYISCFDVFLQAFDRRYQRNRTCCVYNNIRFKLPDCIYSSFFIQENVQIVQPCSTSFQIFREVFHTCLTWQIRDKCGKSAKMIFLFQNKYITSYFSCCTGCFQTSCTTTYNNNIAIFVDFKIFVDISFRNCRVDCTTDRTIYTDTVACTSNITGNTFTQIIFFPILDFFYPVRFCDQSTSHTYDIHISTFQNFLNHLGITIVSCVDYRFAKFILYGSCHIRTPSIWQEIGIDLILKRRIQSTGNIIHIYKLIQIFQIFQCVFQSISTRYSLFCGNTHNDRKPWSYIFTYFFQYHTWETKTVFYRATEFVCSFIIIR